MFSRNPAKRICHCSLLAIIPSYEIPLLLDLARFATSNINHFHSITKWLNQLNLREIAETAQGHSRLEMIKFETTQDH